MRAYTPMDPAEKAAKVARMEARLSGAVSLDDDGNVTKYGVDIERFAELPTTDFGFSAGLPKKEIVYYKLTNQHNNKPITALKEFYERLDALVASSEVSLQSLKEQYGE